MEDIDKEIAIFKRSLQKSTGETINAREYAEKVLYPLLFYCKETVEEFSDLFKYIGISGDAAVRENDNQISAFRSLENKIKALPKNALFVSTRLHCRLYGYQGKDGSNFRLRIDNEADSNSCVWEFYSRNLGYKKEYTGQDLEILKKTFNDMIRFMMKKLSEQSND